MGYEFDKFYKRRALGISCLLCLAFFVLDFIHFVLVGARFTYFMNNASPSAGSDFFFYLLGFPLMGMIVGFSFDSSILDFLLASFLGSLFFLVINGVTYHVIISLNPAFGGTLIPLFDIIYGGGNLFASLPLILRDFWFVYAFGFVLFLTFGFPFILALTIIGNFLRGIVDLYLVRYRIRRKRTKTTPSELK